MIKESIHQEDITIANLYADLSLYGKKKQNVSVLRAGTYFAAANLDFGKSC